MKKIIYSLLTILIPGLLLVAGTFAILHWLNLESSYNIVIEKPTPIPLSKVKIAQVKMGEFFELYTNYQTKSEANWPHFRGVNSDNICPQTTGLIDQISASNIVWSIELGEGHAAAAISEGRVYILDYNEEIKADDLRSFDLKTGTEFWHRWHKIKIKRNHGISRTIPAVNDKYVVAIGPKCHVICVDKYNGDYKWGIDLVEKYGTKIPGWYTGQCPIIENNVAILAPVGTNTLMVGIDCDTGETVWQTPNKWSWKMSHSSIMPMTIDGVKMYVYSAAGGILGVSAEGDNVGEVLWATNGWNHSVVAPSALLLPDNKIFLTAGYGAGSMLIQVGKQDANFQVKILDQYLPKLGLASEQQTPILYKNSLYGVLPKDAGQTRNQLVCLDPNDLHEYLWTSGKTNRFGLGPYIIADEKMFVLSDDGWLTILKVSRQKYEQISKIKVLDGHDAWGPIALVDGYMLLRDSTKMICLDLRK